MINKVPTLSIITPTYNRGSYLQRCYSSLKGQTSYDFEWIIVDDGSSDNTEEVVSLFAKDFDIVYIKKRNGGKHTALNYAHPFIRGKYVLILDSDDYLLSESVEKANRGWAQYDNNKSVGMVVFLKGLSAEEPCCCAKYERIPVEILPSNRIRFHSTDCCEIIRTELFVKYPFPVFKGEKFISEGALWNRVALTHKCVYINEVIYIADYQEDGLTKSGRSMRIRNPRGGMYAARLNMQKKNRFRNRLKNALLYNCYGFFAGMSPCKILSKNRFKGLTLISMLPGWVLYRDWKKRYG